MICCRNVYKSYGEKKVLSGIDLDIPGGTIFGLLGPSGAGKTTLIKILTGQIKADGGSVKILGEDVNELSGQDKKHIGITMDNFGVYDRLSCADNLKIFADIYGVPRSCVKEALQLVGLGASMKKPALELSKGMRVRLCLARAFMSSPEILFLDEPTSGLDPQTMRQIHDIIRDKKNSGCTVFLTTHNMEEAYALCDSVSLLNDGVIVENGVPEEICRKYDHQKKIKMHLSTGEDMEIPHDRQAATVLTGLFENGRIETIHSSEPTLETVFLELTGRKLEDA